MSIRIDDESQQVTSTTGGGCLTLFGLTFVAAGAGFIYALLTGGEVQVNGRPGTPADVWLPGIFVAIGLGIAFTRFRRVVDVRAGEARSVLSLLAVPVWSRTKHIGSIEHVSVAKEVRRSNNSNTTVYPVRVITAAAEDGRVDLHTFSSDLAARRGAERVAKLARVPLHDETAGSTLIRQHHELDQSVLHTLEVPRHRPTPPAGTAIEVQREVGTTTVKVPGASGQQLAVIGGFASFGMIIPLAFWYFAWRPGQQNAESTFELAFLYAPLLIPVLMLVGAALGAATKGLFGQRLIVDRSGLRTRSILGGGFIASGELEELRLVGSRLGGAVLARSDERELRFGIGRTNEERTYLLQVVLYALAGRS